MVKLDHCYWVYQHEIKYDWKSHDNFWYFTLAYGSYTSGWMDTFIHYFPVSQMVVGYLMGLLTIFKSWSGVIPGLAGLQGYLKC